MRPACVPISSADNRLRSRRYQAPQVGRGIGPESADFGNGFTSSYRCGKHSRLVREDRWEDEEP